MDRRHKAECSFYTKVGACKHGRNCDKLHTIPAASQTLFIPHIYPTAEVYSGIDPDDLPELTSPRLEIPTNDYEIQEYKDIFYEDIFSELVKFGDITDFLVSDNVCSHLQGCVLVRYKDLEAAKKAYENLVQRFYDGRVLCPEYSAVVNVRYARCKAHDDYIRGTNQYDCKFGNQCNYIHAVNPSDDIFRKVRYCLKG